MSIFSICCLAQDIVQTHFWLSLCFVQDPEISIHSSQHSPDTWAADHIIAYLFLQWKQNGLLLQNLWKRQELLIKSKHPEKCQAGVCYNSTSRGSENIYYQLRAVYWAVWSKLLDVVHVGSVWLLPTEPFVSDSVTAWVPWHWELPPCLTLLRPAPTEVKFFLKSEKSHCLFLRPSLSIVPALKLSEMCSTQQSLNIAWLKHDFTAEENLSLR